MRRILGLILLLCLANVSKGSENIKLSEEDNKDELKRIEHNSDGNFDPPSSQRVISEENSSILPDVGDSALQKTF
ncbi:hypothetical protein HRbin19_00842 [bacterium HR19]|nr:hypothetical protein HRbin19_00842 [bacterium HR19]